jgi:hypothetical protein
VFVISFWPTKQALETYEKEAYRRVWANLEPFVVERPFVKVCAVEAVIRERARDIYVCHVVVRDSRTNVPESKS